MNCRSCNSPLKVQFVDLNHQPLSNSYIQNTQLNCAEMYYPLRVHYCEACYLVQTEGFDRPEDIFDADYAYF